MTGPKRRALGLAAAMVAAVGLGLGWQGPAATGRAEPGSGPNYHWCPGDDWPPEWGFNWEWALCHDDHHRDIDAADHRYDFLGPPPPGVNPSVWYPLPQCGPLLCWRP